MNNLHQEAVMKVSVPVKDVETIMSDEMIEMIVDMTAKNLRSTLKGIKDFDFLIKEFNEPITLTSGGLLEINITPELEKQDDTSESEQDEDICSFNYHVSYIMDCILGTLIDKYKEILKKDFIPVYCYYANNKNKYEELHDFQGVDVRHISRFEFGITDAAYTRINIIRLIDNSDVVGYVMADIRNGRTLGYISITRRGCEFDNKLTCSDPVLVPAFSGIGKICAFFNDR